MCQSELFGKLERMLPVNFEKEIFPGNVISYKQKSSNVGKLTDSETSASISECLGNIN